MSKTTIFQARLREFESVDGGGLNLDVKSGRIRDDNTVTDKSDQTVALTDNSTNFVELSNLGVASANTASFTSGSTPIAQVVTASGAITTITDKRSWIVTTNGGGVALVSGRVHISTGAVSTTSTSLVDFTGASITLTTGANPALVGFAGFASNTNANANTFFNIDVDGSLQLGVEGLQFEEPAGNVQHNVSFVMMLAALTAASHTFKLQWKVAAGTSTSGGDSNNNVNYWVKETE